ncbi:O-antigen ligase family protein [Sphingomonas colocasiae]|uniref:O-antigen ligase family protein n=1 Tax=Sphingomonas colocasiae TaxID=1848973 RepID=A0ABS7Q2I9_9SPHN|nr:O-antigen ligase family protein [Sphingomonas colocasiae]MBY8826469.1 O-antigen ligase family protein [Sphingomonas colocasiae]
MIGGSSSERTLAVSAWLMVAAMPPFFALSSWAVMTFAPSLLGPLNRYSLPVLAIEMAVVLLAAFKGGGLVAALSALGRPARLLLMALGGVAAGSAMFAADVPAALFGTYIVFLHILFGSAVLSLLKNGAAPDDGRYQWWILTGLIAFLVIIAAYVARSWGIGDHQWFLFGIAASNVRQLGFYSAIGALLALGLAATDGDGKMRWRLLAVSAMLCALSFWSGTRSSLLAIAAAVPVSLAALPRIRRPLALAGLCVSLLGGMVIAWPLPAPSPNYGVVRIVSSTQAARDGVNAMSSGRLAMWRGTLREIARRPWFGHGEGQFRQQVPESGGVFNHPHNIALQLLFQWGVVGTLLSLSLGALLFVRLITAARAAQAEALPPLLVITGLLVYSLYEGTLFHPYPLAMAAFMIAVIMSRAGGDQAGTRLR